MFDIEPDSVEHEVRARARAIAAEILRPRAAELDLRGGFPRESVLALSAAGLMGVNVPRELGGSGLARCRTASRSRSWPTRARRPPSRCA